MIRQALRLPTLFSRPDWVCRRVAALVAVQATRLTRHPWSGEAWPDDAGQIEFRFTSAPGHAIELKWGGGAGKTLPGVPGFFSLTRVDAPGSETPLLKALATVLAGVLKHPELRYLNPAPQAQAADEPQCPELLSSFLPAASLRWFDYSLAHLEGGAEGLRLTFVNGPRQVALAVEPIRERACAAAAGDEPGLFWKGTSFLVRSTGDTRAEHEKRELAHGVERAIVFLVHRFERLGGSPAADNTEPGSAAGGESHVVPFLLPVMAEGAENRRLRRKRETMSADEAWWNPHAEAHIRESVLGEDIDQSHDVWIVGVLRSSCLYVDYPFDAFGPSVGFFHRGVSSRKSLLSGILRGGVYLNEGHFLTDGGLQDWKDFLTSLDRKAGPDTILVSHATCYTKLLGYTVDDPNKNHHLAIKATCATAHPGAGMEEGHEQPTVCAYEALLRHCLPCARSASPSINLIGFPARDDCTELIAELAQIGVQLNSRLVPQASGSEARRFNAAWGQYGLPWKTFYPSVFYPLPVPVIAAPSPSGLQGTLDWLGAIAAALGLKAAFAQGAAERQALIGGLRASWQKRTAATTIGFVADLTTLSRLWDPWRLLGFSLLPFLQEFGFRVAVYYRGSEEELRRARAYMAATLPALGATEEAVAFFPFATRDDFDRLLLAGPAQVFFSDLRSNPALALAGHATFSLDDLELGFAGAERTAERLLRRHAPYWARYRARYNPLVCAPPAAEELP